MKIALLNDSHFGARGDSEVFDNYIHKFMDEIFFPYIKEHNITTLIHLGDILDRRKFINFKTAYNFRHKFMMRLWEEKIDTHIILGNHDTYYRSTNKINGPEELCTTPDGKHEPWIYTKTTEVEFDGMKALFIPWINPENEKETFDILVNTPLKFRDKDYTQEAVRTVYGTAISLTKDGDYNDIRYSIATLDALDCHPDIMDSVYKAHHRFGNLLHDTKFQINFRLEPGDIFSFNNRRLLHGRTEFDPNSGQRHLQGYYMDRDEIIGRLNYLKSC